MECRGGFVAVELHDDSRRFFAESEDSADLPNESGAALRTELAQSEPLTNFKCLRVVTAPEFSQGPRQLQLLSWCQQGFSASVICLGPWAVGRVSDWQVMDQTKEALCVAQLVSVER
jgi:hypothetical protein